MISSKKVKPHFKKEHLTRPLIKHLYYPIAIFFSTIYINLGFSAHLVNITGLLASTASALIIFFIGGKWMILAGFLVLYAYIMDLCDGTTARYYKKKNAMGKWLDESAGFIGVSIVFFALMMKTFIENNDLLIIVLGFIAIFGYLMMNIAAILSEEIRSRFNLSNPADKMRKNLSKKFLGIKPSLFSFSFDVQWTLVALGVIFNLPYLLFIVFGILSNLQWIARYIIFFGK